MTQRAALESTVADHDLPTALVELALGLADAVDAEPGNAAMWREYRAAVKDLMEVVNGSADDDVATFQQSVQSPIVLAAVRNAKNA